MLDETKLRSMVAEIRQAQKMRRQIVPFSRRIDGFDLPSAYRAASFLHQSKLEDNETAVGRKLGFTNPDMWALYGVRQPFWSYVYDTTVKYCTGNHTACALEPFCEPKIEPEIVFRFASAPEADSGIDGLVESLEWVAHGCEIVQSHYPAWDFEAADTVIDHGLHGLLLIGEPRSLRDIVPDPVSALRSFELEIFCGGELCDKGSGVNVLGSPLLALQHLVDVLNLQPENDRLEAGEIVTTGTITRALSIAPGQVWRTSLEGISLPGVTVRCTA